MFGTQERAEAMQSETPELDKILSETFDLALKELGLSETTSKLRDDVYFSRLKNLSALGYEAMKCEVSKARLVTLTKDHIIATMVAWQMKARSK